MSVGSASFYESCRCTLGLLVTITHFSYEISYYCEKCQTIVSQILTASI